MTDRLVPPFRAEFTEPEITEILASTEQILRLGRLVLGTHTEKFEAAMADIAQTEHAVAVNSGSTALQVIYRALETEDRQVLIPTNTNFATAAAAHYAGAKVELYDNGLYPDVDDLEERLRDDTAAVVVVHIGGYVTPEMQRIIDLCEARGIPLIEDAAHAHGASWREKAVGGLGAAAAFSFFPTKTLTTGEGGIITTDDPDLAAKSRQYRDQGKHADGITHEVWGNSWRLTEIGAALGLAQTRHFTEDSERRAAIIKKYESELADTPLIFPEQDPESKPGGYKSIAVLPDGMDRAGLKDRLRQRGVQLGKEVYEKPLHQQPIFQEMGTGEYRQAESFASRHISLPLWRTMPEADVDKVITELNAELRSGS